MSDNDVFAIIRSNQGLIYIWGIEEKQLVCAISKKLKPHLEGRDSLYFMIINDYISNEQNLVLGRTSFSGMFKLFLSQPPFWVQPY